MPPRRVRCSGCAKAVPQDEIHVEHRANHRDERLCNACHHQGPKAKPRAHADPNAAGPVANATPVVTGTYHLLQDFGFNKDSGQRVQTKVVLVLNPDGSGHYTYTDERSGERTHTTTLWRGASTATLTPARRRSSSKSLVSSMRICESG